MAVAGWRVLLIVAGIAVTGCRSTESPQRSPTDAVGGTVFFVEAGQGEEPDIVLVLSSIDRRLHDAEFHAVGDLPALFRHLNRKPRKGPLRIEIAVEPHVEERIPMRTLTSAMSDLFAANEAAAGTRPLAVQIRVSTLPARPPE
jgi:hypothetical protein